MEKTPKRPAKRTHTPQPASQVGDSKSAKRGKKASAQMETEGSEKPNTTSILKPISVNVSVLKKAKQHAGQLGVKTLKAYAESALLYFIKTGLDPTTELNSGQVSVEVNRLRNQVLSFLQTQEQAYILPIFREITGHNSGVDASLSALIGQLEKVYELLYRINQMVHVSTSTTLFVSGMPPEQIADIKEKNRTFVEGQVREFVEGKQG